MPEINGRKLNYDYPIYQDLIQPNGALVLDKRSHACWRYTILTMRARLTAGKGPEGQIIQYKVGDTPPEWMESRDLEIAKSIAIQYGLESPDEFLKFKKECWVQAVMLGLEIDPSIYLVTPQGDHNKIQ